MADILSEDLKQPITGVYFTGSCSYLQNTVQSDYSMYDVFHYRCPAYLHILVTFTESDSASIWLTSSISCF